MKKILFSLVFLVCLGLTACGGGGPTDTSNYHPSVVFVETWESYPVGSFPGGGWKNHSQPYYEKKIEYPSNHKMLLDGPTIDQDGHVIDIGESTGGIYYNFKKGTMKPSYIHYKIHPYSHDPAPGDNYSSIAHFTVEGLVDESNLYTIPISGIKILFQQYRYGYGSIVANGLQINNGAVDSIPIDNSFEIELKNIDWASTSIPTYDLWINGVEVESCIHFRAPIKSITHIYFHNQDYGRFHLDNIYMANFPVQNDCFPVDEPAYPDTMPIPPMPPPSDPVLFIFEMPAFCRGGPSTEYPELSTYPEGAELEVNGQNIESNWWWSEGGGCWVSDSVGQLKGDRTTLEIIIPPPPQAEDDSLDKDPGKTSSCKKNLGKGDCIKAGGTWEESPTQAGTCVCP